MSTYAFVNANGKTAYISDSNIIYCGSWSSIGTYVPPMEVVTYNNGQFIVLVQNANTPPFNSPSWSELVLTGTVNPDDQFDIAKTALATATSASALAQTAYDIAITDTGTIATNLLAPAASALLTQEYGIYDPNGSPHNQKVTGQQMLSLFFGGGTNQLTLVGGPDDQSRLVIGPSTTGYAVWSITADDDDLCIQVYGELFLQQAPGVGGADLTVVFDEIDFTCPPNGMTMNGANTFSGTFPVSGGKTATVVNGLIMTIQ